LRPIRIRPIQMRSNQMQSIQIWPLRTAKPRRNPVRGSTAAAGG
jgi:hypothetical protein